MLGNDAGFVSDWATRLLGKNDGDDEPGDPEDDAGGSPEQEGVHEPLVSSDDPASGLGGQEVPPGLEEE